MAPAPAFAGFLFLGGPLHAAESWMKLRSQPGAKAGPIMRSVEFFTYLLPSDRAGGQPQPSRFKLTSWQAVAYPGATCVETSREVRLCPESPDERALLGIPGLDDDGSAPRP
jgi:hypothetical protein